jgi:hypothetical protein
VLKNNLENSSTSGKNESESSSSLIACKKRKKRIEWKRKTKKTKRFEEDQRKTEEEAGKSVKTIEKISFFPDRRTTARGHRNLFHPFLPLSVCLNV